MKLSRLIIVAVMIGAQTVTGQSPAGTEADEIAKLKKQIAELAGDSGDGPGTDRKLHRNRGRLVAGVRDRHGDLIVAGLGRSPRRVSSSVRTSSARFP